MCDCQGNQSPARLLNMSLSLSRPLALFVGLKKIRNPERMVRIAVGYTGHTPPKSDDTDANSPDLGCCFLALVTSLGVWVCARDVVGGASLSRSHPGEL